MIAFGEIERIGEEEVVSYFIALVEHSRGRTGKNHEKPQAVGVSAEIRTGWLPNTVQKHCRLSELARSYL
jgi:hypothetical protein